MNRIVSVDNVTNKVLNISEGDVLPQKIVMNAPSIPEVGEDTPEWQEYLMAQQAYEGNEERNAILNTITFVFSETAQIGDTWDGENFYTNHSNLPTADEEIKGQILALEGTITPRRMREAVLSQTGKDWLSAVDAQISALRGQLS